MALALFVIFIVVPIAELYVIIEVGQLIGVLPTIALLIADSILGALLLRSQGRAAWARFNEALAARRVPALEVLDGAMIILGGAFLLTPGFITDVFGLLLLLPPTRAIARRFAGRLAKSNAYVRVASWGASANDARRRRRARGDGIGSRPGTGSTRRRGYDLDGTAREVGEDPEIERRGDGS